MQRLRGIDTSGASRYILPERPSSTRFEHSLGVMYILRVLGASLEEQVAGLLHDAPHTAFSHTVDIVFPSQEYNYHELFQHEVIMRSDIPAILARHGMDLRPALEPDTFPLLEQPLPDICADRLDYALRDLRRTGHVSTVESKNFLSHLVVTPDGLLIDNRDDALWFSKLFSHANDTFWTGPEEAGAYWALAGAIKRAFEIGGFTEDDLFSTDDAAMTKLRSLDDALVQTYLDLLKPGTRFVEAAPDGPFFITHMKQRIIDPQVIEPGQPVSMRLSQLSPEYAWHLRDRQSARSTEYRLWSPSIGPELERTVDGRRWIVGNH